MRKLSLVLLGALLASFAALFAGSAPASASPCAFPVYDSQSQVVGCVGGGNPGAGHSSSHHKLTVEQKAWARWSKEHRTFTAWKHHHKHFVKHHSHRAKVHAWKHYRHSHGHKWWARHVWRYHRR